MRFYNPSLIPFELFFKENGVSLGSVPCQILVDGGINPCLGGNQEEYNYGNISWMVPRTRGGLMFS